MKKVEFYIVGGYVRDKLMGGDAKDRDYVVVGANRQYMLDNGYAQVGVDFPVFISKDGDEYALARKERSNGDGYVDFEFDTEGVSLEDDLERRDLTINAIAMDMVSGELIDPFGGQQDIQDKVFRPVSNAFEEDPVRVLRVARLRARFGEEWSYSDSLISMVSRMVKHGKLDSLQKDRVWKEMSRALMEPYPRLFFDTLLELDALHVVFPEIYKLLTALEIRRYHPEGNAYEHVMLVLTQAAINGYDLKTRYACLMHDIGKTLTPFDKLPKHYGHDVNGVELVKEFSDKYSVPTDIKRVAMICCKHHMKGHTYNQLNKKTIVRLMDELNVNHTSLYSDALYQVFICDERGRLGSESNSVDHLGKFLENIKEYKSVKFSEVFPKGETNTQKIKDGLFKCRVSNISK